MQTLNAFITPETCQQEHNKAALVIVIDVLRASSTIVTAFANGCRSIYPVKEVEAAFKKAEELKWNDVILGGEREGRKVQGFDLGNSPREYIRELVSGKNIVFTTTNGTKALSRCAEGEKAIVLSFLNLRAVTHFILNNPSDVTILCAGEEGRESPEDCACAGTLIRLLSGQGVNFLMNKTAQVLLNNSQLDDQHVLSLLRSSTHGAYLEKIGFAADLDFCAQINKYDIVPVYQNGVLVS